MSKLIDLTGQRFGSWTVLNRAENISKNASWVCKCDCGNIKTVRGDLLRQGISTHCGCQKPTKTKKVKTPRYENLLNQKFGNLTVVALSDRRTTNGGVYWQCQCDCGNKIEVSATRLKNGKKTNCGCVKNKDLTGQKFGYLTVTKRVNNDDLKHAYWECFCDCGNPYPVIVRQDHLIDGTTKSCGCIKKSCGEYKIQQLLTEANIVFKKEYRINDCRFPDTNVLARFDFYLPDYNILIEYDGIQHFQEPTSFKWENLAQVQKRDQFKNDYCKKHNLSLIRIPYTHYNELCLEDLLNNSSFFVTRSD